VDKIMSDQEIENYIWTENDTKDLYRAVIASGGLSEKPFIMRDGIVKEGNRRVVVLRKAQQQAKQGKLKGISKDAFDEITVDVFSDDITAEEMDVWLARVHVTGKKEWGALNQADHLYRLYNDRGYSYERIRDLLGMGKAEVIRKISAYGATRDYLRETKDSDVTKYSFFEELYKKRPLVALYEGDPSFRGKVSEWIRQGKFDLTGAKDMRQLMEVLNDKDAKKAFESKGMAAAVFEMQKKNPAMGSSTFKAVDSALHALKGMPRGEVKDLRENSREVELLGELRKEIDQLLKDAGID